MCRMHGAGGGGPSGRKNGNYRHGGRTNGTTDAVRYINALAKNARDSLAPTSEMGLACVKTPLML